MIETNRTTKLQYRLLADGTIIDQKTGKTAGYVTSKSDLEKLWSMKGYEKQKSLRKIVEE